MTKRPQEPPPPRRKDIFTSNAQDERDRAVAHFLNVWAEIFEDIRPLIKAAIAEQIDKH